MKIGMHRIVGFLIALVSLALGLQSLEARMIYIGVSNPDMSFLSGGVAKFQGYFKDDGLEVEVLQRTPMCRWPRWPPAISTII